jgi:outer membrane protein assembly factor BamB
VLRDGRVVTAWGTTSGKRYGRLETLAAIWQAGERYAIPGKLTGTAPDQVSRGSRDVAVGAWVAIACLLSAIAVISSGSGTPSRPSASGAPSVSVLWTDDTSAYNTRPAVAGGTVYIGDGGGTVGALNATTGDIRWTYTTAPDPTYDTTDPVDSGPVVTGRTVYVSTQDGRVYALDAATGRLRWAYTTGDAVGSSPAVAGGRLYIGGDDGMVYALGA